MTISAYAKVNLTLEVFGIRPDGFHALRSVVMPIGLADTLTFTPADSFSTDTGYPNDLILKAAHALRMHICSEPKPHAQRISVTKRIPAGGGLGGGSADAAATLLALNELWGLKKSPEELAAIGAGVGSDVPALVLANHYRAPVLMQGRGEKVSLLFPIPCSLFPIPFSLVLVTGGPVSTPEVYARCRPRVTTDNEILYTMRTALESKDLERIASALMNDLQPPAIAIRPEIASSLEALHKAGVAGAMMSGSGSTVFGLVPTEGEGREIARLLTAQGFTALSVGVCPVV